LNVAPNPRKAWSSGASLGIGWPLASLFALIVAIALAQVASAYPTAGGIYHWASILGGRGWGWAAAWFNLLGLITVPDLLFKARGLATQNFRVFEIYFIVLVVYFIIGKLSLRAIRWYEPRLRVDVPKAAAHRIPQS